MKVTEIDHGEWTETRFEPDKPSATAGNGKTTNEHAAGATSSTATAANAWPVLDKTAYYGLAGEVVATILPHTEADPAALLLQYLTCFGNMVPLLDRAVRPAMRV